jgi:hypothetical protein
MNANDATAATSVPSIRMAPWFSDCPAVDRAIIATPNPAHFAFSQSIHKAMPTAIVIESPILIASLVRVDKGNMALLILRFCGALFNIAKFHTRFQKVVIRRLESPPSEAPGAFQKGARTWKQKHEEVAKDPKTQAKR